MSTTTASRPPTGPSRRSPPAVSGASNAAAPTIPKGATARSAVSPRMSVSLSTPGARRASLKGAISPPLNLPEGSRESLAASLKLETQEKERLLLQLQDKEQTIASLKSDNTSLSSAIHTTETRLTELYADQSRAEEEMAARVEVIEKLRSQTRELEKEKRDAQRRYNEQTATFEAERQAFYDNEQHLKSRIQSLSQARKQAPLQIPPSPSVISVVESEAEVEEEHPQPPVPTRQDMGDPEQEPAEMTALRLELSTLATSHNSLQSTLVLLQTQLIDLKRVNRELQEENESYNILLREKTLSGQFDVLRMGGASEAEPTEPSSSGDDDLDNRDADSLRSRGTGRSILDPVDELAEEQEDQDLQAELDPEFGRIDDRDGEQDENEPVNRSRTRHGRKRSSLIIPRGESLANLPITGPGLDLAAELGRAENKDMLEGRATLDDRTNIDSKARKSKKDASRKVSTASSDPTLEPSTSTLTDIESLRNEVKSLKDANKALSLYASKIIDRIISQEGFEHVLAVDYEKPPATPVTSSLTASPEPATALPQKKARAQTMMFSRSTPATTNNTPLLPPVEKLTTFESLTSPSTPVPSEPAAPASTPAPASNRASRRSMSFDWRSFSVFGGAAEKKPEPTTANLRPLTLKAGAPVVTGARKLETTEDEDDRRERERLNATMKLMGIEKSDGPASPLPPMLKSFSAPAPSGDVTVDSPVSATTVTPVAPTPAARFSFFRRTPSVRSEPPSLKERNTPSPVPTANLTAEALEQADAEATLAALDAHERQLSAEIAKGAGSGYTEIVRRSGDRRSSRHSGSGSTVWSAGMSKHEDDD